MDKSKFFPTACSTVNRKKGQKLLMDNSDFEEQNSMFSINSSQQRESMSNASYQLEEQRQLAQKSLRRANKVAAIPSKYLRANFSEFETQTNICNESTISESDLLQTPRNASTPRSSIHSNSLLGDSLAKLSFKATDGNFSIDNLVNDFKKVIKTADEHRSRSSIFKPGEEAADILMADEMSWRRKNEMPLQVEEFSGVNFTEQESLGAFFQQRCNTLSDFPGGESPDVTREPVPLIEPSISLVPEDIPLGLEQKSISISAIQNFLASEDTPKRTTDDLFKFGAKSEEFATYEFKPTNSLPISKNSSYTSDHSDNEALKLICNKENVDSLNTNGTCTMSAPSSRSSSRASSSLTSLQNGKLPIETTKCDLVWGCVKVGKCMTQEFIIRNRSTKRLGLQLSLSSQEFKIRKENRSDSEPLSANKILLHPHESKTVIVSFIPTKVGAAVDELYFTSLDPNLKQIKRQCVKLFGYGGSCKVDFNNLTRDTTGKFWLPLGKLDDRTVITSKFNVKNRGDTPVFIHISINSIEMMKLNVSTTFFVLIPQEERDILVSYKPSNEDYIVSLRSIHNGILDLGNLNVTFGTEVDRGRLRKICEKCIANGKKVDQTAIKLIEKIDGEIMPVDLVKFHENPSDMKELIKLFNQYQIVLTLERDPEQTIIPQFSDDSGMYQSLYQDTTILSNKEEILNSCYIAPSIIVLTLPYKHKDTIFLKSDNKNKLNFIVNCQEQDLELKPKEGILEPHGTVIINVKYSGSTSLIGKKHLKVLIIVESEIFEVDVKVESLGQIKSKNKSVLNCIV